MEKNLTYFSMNVFIILYMVVWTILSLLFYFLGKVSLNDPFSRKTVAFMVMHLTAMTFFFLCVFYSPWNRALTKGGDDAKKKYESVKAKTEAVYQDQIKAFWVDALNKQNRYYFISFMILSVLPFFYFLFYITTHDVPQIETFLNETFSFLLLLISIFYTAIVLLVYTVCHEKVYMVLPFLMFGFFVGMLYFQRPIPFLTTVGFLALCLVESILVFKKVAFAWCLIPLVPLYLTLFILYTQ
uniref:Uncharacterized protein n=1 Tax=viral metagenome TaxID=1070528 RepID=A0A6C0HXF9_9ZZZZ